MSRLRTRTKMEVRKHVFVRGKIECLEQRRWFQLRILFLLINKLRIVLSHSIRLTILHFPKFRAPFYLELLKSGLTWTLPVLLFIFLHTSTLWFAIQAPCAFVIGIKGGFFDLFLRGKNRVPLGVQQAQMIGTRLLARALIDCKGVSCRHARHSSRAAMNLERASLISMPLSDACTAASDRNL